MSEVSIWPNRFVRSEEVPPDQLLANPYNHRIHTQLQQEHLKEVLDAIGWIDAVKVNINTGHILDGHLRVTLALRHDQPTIPVDYYDLTLEEEELALVTYDFITGEAIFDREMTGSLIKGIRGRGDQSELGVLASMIVDLSLNDEEVEAQIRQKLSDRFGAPPFTVLDARQGYWQDRKRAWLALGIKSEIGRGENLLKMSEVANRAMGETAYPKGKALAFKGQTSLNKIMAEDSKRKTAMGAYALYGDSKPLKSAVSTSGITGTSIFDPVLAELMYLWFSSPGGSVLDPFAGGSVRGIVAGMKGRSYTGVDLSAEQVEENREQAKEILKKENKKPKWIVGDSLGLPNLLGNQDFDFVFSCPPYGDLEQYSEDPKDLSNMPPADFDRSYAEIIRLACQRLRMHRFACFVVGDYRDSDGLYRNFGSKTIAAFNKAGLRLYNEAILITALGSLPIRATKIFTGGRKLGKTHQNVLIFVKGDWRKAHEACGSLEGLFDG